MRCSISRGAALLGLSLLARPLSRSWVLESELESGSADTEEVVVASGGTFIGIEVDVFEERLSSLSIVTEVDGIDVSDAFEPDGVTDSSFSTLELESSVRFDSDCPILL